MSYSLPSLFEDLDQQSVFDRLVEALDDNVTRNFVVEFDSTSASAAQDLDAAQLEAFLNLERKKDSVARWIHIFGPERQVDSMAKIGMKYQLSLRLQKIMMSPNLLPYNQPSKMQTKNIIDGPESSASTSPVASNISMDKGAVQDAEKGNTQQRFLPTTSGLGGKQALNHYRMVNDVWHFWSIDWSANCMCIGYNSLSNLVVDTPTEDDKAHRSSRQRLKRKMQGLESKTSEEESHPNATRLWMWLLVCEDNTVISILENPFPGSSTTPLIPEKQQILSGSRHTLRNVFKHLSKAKREEDELAIDTLDIRPGCSPNQKSTVGISDSSGLLFYYLFDDWYTTFQLVADRNYRYATILDDLVGPKVSWVSLMLTGA